MDIFDDEWMTAIESVLGDLPTVEGADVVIDYVISGSPAGKTTIGVTLCDGRVASVTVGKSASADVVISMKYDTAVAILTGELSGDTGFMNGAVKVEGAHERWLLDLRTVRRSAIAALAPVMAETVV
jgi:SCP-2 sterol transfer family